MKVRIKTFDGKPLEYHTDGAVGFDFKTMNDTTFGPGEFKLVDTGTVIETPDGFMLQVQPRSSTFKKFGLIQANSVGIVDQDYCGDEDTIKFPFINFTNNEQFIPAGTRIGQGVFVKIEKPEFELVENMEEKNRGGFGTTG